MSSVRCSEGWLVGAPISRSVTTNSLFPAPVAFVCCSFLFSFVILQGGAPHIEEQGFATENLLCTKRKEKKQLAPHISPNEVAQARGSTLDIIHVIKS